MNLLSKAVIYARYSCDNQREESIEGQLRECKAFAERNGYTIVTVIGAVVIFIYQRIKNDNERYKQYASDLYPEKLREIEKPPSRLYVIV